MPLLHSTGRGYVEAIPSPFFTAGTRWRSVVRPISGRDARDRSARRNFQIIDVGDEAEKIPLSCSAFSTR
jgi:hypothetical protein